MPSLHPALLVAVSVVALSSCDVFTSRVPCAVDDECDAAEICVDGFCADDDGTGREGEGEGEGEGLESHPLRGSSCDEPAAPAIADAGLRCFISGVFEEPCAIDDDCGDPTASLCVDPGAGPRLCAPTADFTRSACADDDVCFDGAEEVACGGDPDAVLSVVSGIDVPGTCFDGSVIGLPTLICGSSAVYITQPQTLGGDFTARLNRRQEDAVFCGELESIAFGTEQIGGSVRVGPDIGNDGAQPTALVGWGFPDLRAVFGDFVLEDTEHLSVMSAGASPSLRVLGDVIVRRNAGLKELRLADLIEVDDLIISDNPALVSIDAVPAIIGGDLIVRNSPLLTCAMIEPLVEATVGRVDILGVAEPCP